MIILGTKDAMRLERNCAVLDAAHVADACESRKPLSRELRAQSEKKFIDSLELKENARRPIPKV